VEGEKGKQNEPRRRTREVVRLWYTWFKGRLKNRLTRKENKTKSAGSTYQVLIKGWPLVKGD